MQRTTLAALTPEQLADAFNVVYTDYVTAFVVDAGWAAHHVAAMSIVPTASPLWLDDTGAVIGLAALGVRGERGWVGGFGVAPAHRGTGMSHALIDALLESARQYGVSAVSLEVLTNNPRAIRTYERAGFVRRRDLRIFQWDTPIVATNDVVPADPAALLVHRARIGALPPWQREPLSLRGMIGLEGFALGAPTTPEAFVLYRATERAVVVVDVAATEPAAVAPLLGAIMDCHPGIPLRLTNEPEESVICGVLDALGAPEVLRQHEMVFR